MRFSAASAFAACAIGTTTFPWTPVAAQPACETESDCLLVANYCGGCSCESVHVDAEATTCSPDTPAVNCFADPCRKMEAACSDDGECIIAGDEADTAANGADDGAEVEPDEQPGTVNPTDSDPTPDPTDSQSGTVDPTDSDPTPEPTTHFPTVEPTAPETEPLTEFPAETCTGICQRADTPPPEQNLPVEFVDATCGELDFEAQNSPYYPCAVYHYFGALCGCPDQAPPEDGCGLCQAGGEDGGGEVTTPDLIMDNYTNETCGFVELEALYITDDIYECGLYHIMGNKCGCTNVPDPEFGCRALCDDGEPVPNPGAFTPYGLCEEMEQVALFNPSKEECDDDDLAYQGMLCGCDNTPPAGACGSLCKAEGEDEEEDGDGEGSTTALPDPDMFISSLGLTCAEIQDVSMWDTRNDCAEYALYASLCNCPNSEPPEEGCGPLCEDGTPLPDPDMMVYGENCSSWEVMSLFDTREDSCLDYGLIGTTCGCNNTPPTDSCGPLCGEGVELPFPDEEIYGMTCAQWDLESMYNVYSGEYCTLDYEDVAYVCGCPVDPPTEGCGMLCTDGTTVPDPTLVVENKTCGMWELESLFDYEGPYEGWCGEYQYYGLQCGCDNVPPDDACHFCDGPLAFPDKVSTDQNGEVYTCDEDAAYYSFMFDETEKECDALRSVFGPYCGCTSASPDKVCSICPEGQLITMNISPDFSFTDPFYGEITVDGEVCLSIEFLINLERYDAEQCGTIAGQIAEGCCEVSNTTIIPIEEDGEKGEGGGTPTPTPPAPSTPSDPSPSGARRLSAVAAGALSIATAGVLLLCFSSV